MPSRSKLAARNGIAPGAGAMSGIVAGDQQYYPDAVVGIGAEAAEEGEPVQFEAMEHMLPSPEMTTIENPDGSATFELGSPSIVTAADVPFDANLADPALGVMGEAELSRIGGEIIEAVEEDKQSRQQWEDSYVKGMKLLGLTTEDRTAPFKGACGVYDPLMNEAAIRFQATFRAEMLPAMGPAKTQIIGQSSDVLEAKASRTKTWMNYYLTEIDTAYYDDRDQMGWWLPLVGSTFVKIYTDPILQRPVLPFILPDYFLVNYTAASVDSASRITNIIPTTIKDMRMRQLAGFYSNIDLGAPQSQTRDTRAQEMRNKITGSEPGSAQWDNLYFVAESHVDYDLRGYGKIVDTHDEGLPLPYIVAVDMDTRKVLSIRRNWKQGDKTFTKKKYFVQYKYLPGPGVYGLGLAHVLGGYAQAATSLTRQIIDSGTLASFPGGLRVKGMRMDDNNLGIGPTEFREIETGGLPIQNAVMMMPYKDPSQVLLEMRREVREGAERLASTTEIAVGEGRQDAPVGTTVALMEAAMRVQSAIMKRCYVAMRAELRMLAANFAETLPETPYPYKVPGGEHTIMRQDFDNRIDVVPVADPNISSAAQRLMLAEGKLRLAQSAPQLHDERAAYHQMYVALDVPQEQIDQLLPPPAQGIPTDPVTENQMAMGGAPVAVGPWQDDDSHIQVHMQALAMAPSLMAHITEHLASKYRKVVEMALGQPLPPPGTQLPPEVENMIAFAVAQASETIKQAMATAPGTQGLSPEMVAMADVQVKAQDVARKAAEDQTKASLKAMEITTKYADRAQERSSKESIARLKAAVELADNRNPPRPESKALLDRQ